MGRSRKPQFTITTVSAISAAFIISWILMLIGQRVYQTFSPVDQYACPLLPRLRARQMLHLCLQKVHASTDGDRDILDSEHPEGEESPDHQGAADAEDGLTPERVYARRVSRVEAACARYQRRGFAGTLRGVSSDVLRHVLVDDKYKMLYCNIPKVGCTNWKRVLLALRYDNISKPMDVRGDLAHWMYLPTLSEYNKSEVQSRLDTYFKFMFVRHPLERLHSAYRDKLAKKDYYNGKIGSLILKRFRSDAPAAVVQSGTGVTLGEFVRYLLLPDTHRGAMDHHWGRYYELCNPCALNYHVIGKFSTVERDSQYILDKVGVTQVKFPTRSESFGDTNRSAELWRRAFDELRETSPDEWTENIRALKDIYRLDYDMFGY